MIISPGRSPLGGVPSARRLAAETGWGWVDPPRAAVPHAGKEGRVDRRTWHGDGSNSPREQAAARRRREQQPEGAGSRYERGARNNDEAGAASLPERPARNGE